MRGARSTHFPIPSYAIALLMAMMNPNDFMPLPGAAAKDSCLFVKVWRISVRPGTLARNIAFPLRNFEFPYLLGIIYAGGRVYANRPAHRPMASCALRKTSGE